MSRKSEKSIFGGIRHMAIAKRITLLYGGIFSFSLLSVSVFMAFNIASFQQVAIRRELMRTLTNIQSYLEDGGEMSEGAFAGLLDNKYVEVSVYSLRDGKSYNNYVWEIPAFLMGEKATPLPEPMLPGGQEWPEESYALKEKDLRNVGFQIHMKRENDGGMTEYILRNEKEQQFMLVSSVYRTQEDLYSIRVFKMMDEAGYLLRHFVSTLALIDFVGIFCAFLIGQYISQRILRPVEAIRSAAERISIEDLSQRIPAEGPEDEMKELTTTFNSMIERLETAFQRQNQFVSDASHELRTPISVIQGYANLINRWGKNNPAVLQESIDSILTETDHMSALIRQLLFLAKSDQKRMHTQKARISLNEVAAEFVRELEILDSSRQIRFQEESGVTLWADYDMVKQLLWIHGENALKYTRENGRIDVRVWQDGECGCISIADDGIGISAEDQTKIFDRFYRADKSRSKEISGTGLGLAIARWIMDCHDGEITLESEPGQGTVFTDRFPLYTEGKEERRV